MFTVYGNQLGMVVPDSIHENFPRHDQGLLVSQQYPFPCTGGRQCRQQAGCPDNSSHDNIHIRVCSNSFKSFCSRENPRITFPFFQGFFQFACRLFIRHYRKHGLPLQAEFCHFCMVMIGCQCKNTIIVCMLADNIECINTNTACCTKYRNLFHVRPSINNIPSTNTGAEAVRLSILSSTPP